jgi:hypothetical protein
MHSSSTSTGSARRLAGLALPAAGLLMIAGGIVDPHVDESTLTTYFAGLADETAQTRYQISAMLLHFGFLLMIPAILGLARLARPSRWRAAGVVLGVSGFATLSGLVVTDYLDIALAATLPAEQAAAITEDAQGLLGAQLLAIPSSLGATVGLTAAIVCAWRAGAVQAWAIVVIPVAMIAPYAMGRSITGFVVMAAVLAVAFALIARRLLGDAAPRAGAPTSGPVAVPA